MSNGVLTKTDRDLVEESGWKEDVNEYPGYINTDKMEFGGCDAIEIFTRDIVRKEALVEFDYLVDMDIHGLCMFIGVVSVADMFELQVKLTALAQYKELQQRHFEAECPA
jgi:hypothetical protein